MERTTVRDGCLGDRYNALGEPFREPLKVLVRGDSAGISTILRTADVT